MKLKKYYLNRKNMKKNITILLSLFFLINFTELNANSLKESLNLAYQNNNKLNAERANLRATRAEQEGSLSEFKPSITISGYVSEQDNTKTTGTKDTNIGPTEQSILIEQKIFQSFGGLAKVKKEKFNYNLSKFKLKKVEQETLLAAAKAHTDYLLNEKKVQINNINIDLLERQIDSDKNRLERGEINLTDLAQSEASLAGARAKLIAAQNDLITSKANFENIIGISPSKDFNSENSVIFNLPKNLAESIKISEHENPDIKIAQLEYEKSQQDIIIARSDLSPSATLSYKLSEQEDVSSTVKDRTQQTLKATATWPLYSGGSNYSNLKKAKELKGQKELLLEDNKKIIKTKVVNAWSSFQSNKSVLNSIRSQVRAAEIANEGITQENETGSSRTTLEVIQSRTILLESRINLATSERDYLISQFDLLASIGRLTAGHLDLNSN